MAQYGAVGLAALVTVVCALGVAALTRAASKLQRRGHANVSTSRGTYRGLVIGTDNRVSTSKLMACLWTFILLFIILGIVFSAWGAPARYDGEINSIDPIYLVLLGGPFAAAVLAKGIVSGAVDSGTTQKSVASSPSASNVFSDDDGNADIVDIQYLLFNLVAAVIVLAQFVPAPAAGAPAIPAFLAGLTSASAATYVANKAVNVPKNPPTVSLVSPSTGRPDSSLVIIGSDFMVSDGAQPSVYIGGLLASVDSQSTASNLIVAVPEACGSGSQPIVVSTLSGLAATGATVEIEPDTIAVSSVDSTRKAPGDTLVVHGDGFFAAGDLTPQLTPRTSRLRPAVVSLRSILDDAGPEISCPPSGVGSNVQITVTIPAATAPGDYRIMLARTGVSCVADATLTIA